MASTTFELAADWEATVVALAEPAMESAALIVANGQRRRIPVSADGSNGRAPGYARSRVHVERGRDAIGPWRDVGSDAKSATGADYPLILELGSRPHTITSHGNYPLRDRHGHIFGRQVQHPGTRPYPWCRAALQDLAGRHL